MIERCRESKLGYVAWHLDAERRMKRGEKQTFCMLCGVWNWPHEVIKSHKRYQRSER